MAPPARCVDHFGSQGRVLPVSNEAPIHTTSLLDPREISPRYAPGKLKRETTKISRYGSQPKSLLGARLPQPTPCRETSCAWWMESLPQGNPHSSLQKSRNTSEEAAGAREARSTGLANRK